MTDNISLNFINKSNNTNNSQVVIFQNNIAQNFDEIAIAWKVIKNCDRLNNHPFIFPLKFNISVSDSYGNYTPKLQAFNGQAFEMIKDTSGDILRLSSTPVVNTNEVEILNNLANGSIDVNCYKDGKLLAKKTGVAPGQKAVFEFRPIIYIGVVSQVEEGEIMNSEMISQITTSINLFGITSANIVMTGAGPDNNATPFNFHLENINQ
ncbi:hypothetical protein ACSIGC_14535 [Tenacibaculum sp. ZS6-P6]|uniref:hypothetical protein n=1 Tax=Tenacibaculum sp. ZS6-P6 TaxID=3447503 RepID=UPI003F9B5FFA